MDDATSVRAEMRDLVGASPARLWRLAHLCARDALWAIRAGSHAERVLTYRDPVPESTKHALARLREQSRWSRGAP